MLCPNCGSEIPEGRSSCEICGTQVPQNAGQTTPKKSKKPLLIGAAIVACIAVIAGIAASSLLKSPKSVVLQAFSNTASAIAAEETGLDAYLGKKELAELLATGKSRLTTSAQVPMKDLGVDMSGNAGLSFIVEKDAADEMYMDIRVMLLGMNISAAKMYADKVIVLAAIPKLYDQSFYLDCQKLKEMVKSGEFFDYLSDVYDIELSEEERESLQEMIEKNQENFVDSAAKYAEYTAEPWAELVKNIKVEKKDSAKFTIGGEERTCKSYQITAAKADIDRLLDGTMAYLEDQAVLYAETAVDEDYLEIIRNFRGKLDQLFDHDLTCTAYVSPNDRLIALGFDDTLDEYDIKAEFHLLGTVNPLDDLYASLETNFLAISSNNDHIGVEFTRVLDDNDDILEDSVTLKVSSALSDLNSFSIDYDGSLKKENGDWEADVSIEIEDEGTAVIALSGAFEDVEKGTSFTLICDHLKADIPGEDSQAPNFKFTYGIEAIDEIDADDIKSMDRFDVLDADMDDWNEVINEISDNVQSLVYSTLMGGLF